LTSGDFAMLHTLASQLCIDEVSSPEWLVQAPPGAWTVHATEIPCKPADPSLARKPLAVVRRLDGSNPSASAVAGFLADLQQIRDRWVWVANPTLVPPDTA
jgi:hypothetical protein